MLDLFQIELAWSLLGFCALAGGIIATGWYSFAPVVTRIWRRYSAHPWAAPITTALAMLVLQILIATRYGLPVPAIHDEFSHLLAARTYAAGRLTNPTPPAWEHLETWHVLMQPTYQSKYPPGHGLTLALGIVLMGLPIVGSWLVLAAGAGLTVWMLRGWVPARWASWGGLIPLCNWPLCKLWGQTYLAGAGAWCGGLLLLGALPRMLRCRNKFDLFCLSLGLLILSQTRPYEGALLSVVALAWWFAQPHPHGYSRSQLTRTLLVTGLVILLCTAYYNWVVTGSIWTMPYRLYEATYSRRTTWLQTIFFWTELGERPRTIPSLEGESTAAFRRLTESRPELFLLWKIIRNLAFQIGIVWLIPAVFAVRYFSLRGRSLILAGLILVGGAILLQRSAALPHYAAPLYPLTVLWIVQGTRGLTHSCRKLARSVNRLRWDWPVWCVTTAGMYLMLGVATRTLQTNVRPWSLRREAIRQDLLTQGGRHLVIVRYDSGHPMHEEWVYNDPLPAQAPVVWARLLDEQSLATLMSAYPDHKYFIVEPDQHIPLSRTDAANLPAPAARGAPDQ